MAIPGLRPQFEVRAKVRVGEKRQGERDGRSFEYPVSTDYFVCDDPEFVSLCGEKPKELTVLLPFAELDHNFSTGLERWDGQMLTCYSKGEQSEGRPVAWRKPELKGRRGVVNLLEGFEATGATAGKDRCGVVCRVRDCPDMLSKACKPMGRLQFFIPGSDPARGVFQLDTKSWHSIERIEAFLSMLGDPRGRPLTLRVQMWSRGTSKFPVVTLEDGVKVNSPTDVELSDCLVQLRGRLEDGSDDSLVKIALAASLDVTNPGWRGSAEFVNAMKQRVEQIGVRAAAEALLERHSL